MNATEVIEEIKKLPRTEQQNVLTSNVGKLLLFGCYAIGKAFGEQVKVFQEWKR